MKHADCVGHTARNQGGSKTLTGMLLNQINGLKLLHTSSSQCSGHHVQLRGHCIVGVEYFHIRGRSTRSSKIPEARNVAGADGIPDDFRN